MEQKTMLDNSPADSLLQHKECNESPLANAPQEEIAISESAKPKLRYGREFLLSLQHTGKKCPAIIQALEPHTISANSKPQGGFYSNSVPSSPIKSYGSPLKTVKVYKEKEFVSAPTTPAKSTTPQYKQRATPPASPTIFKTASRLAPAQATITTAVSPTTPTKPIPQAAKTTTIITTTPTKPPTPAKTTQPATTPTKTPTKKTLAPSTTKTLPPSSKTPKKTLTPTAKPLKTTATAAKPATPATATKTEATTTKCPATTTPTPTKTEATLPIIASTETSTPSTPVEEPTTPLGVTSSTAESLTPKTPVAATQTTETSANSLVPEPAPISTPVSVSKLPKASTSKTIARTPKATSALMPITKKSKTPLAKNNNLFGNNNINASSQNHFKENVVNAPVIASASASVAKILFPPTTPSATPSHNPKLLGKKTDVSLVSPSALLAPATHSPVVLSPLPMASYISCGNDKLEIDDDEEDDCWEEREWEVEKNILSSTSKEDDELEKGEGEEGENGKQLAKVVDSGEAEVQRMRQRLKQIEYGKRTVGYQRFIALVPQSARLPSHPTTPRPTQKCSKRSWDGQIRKWRRELHKWDPVTEDEMKYYEDVVMKKFGILVRGGEDEREEREELVTRKEEERREKWEDRARLQDNLSAESPPFLPRFLGVEEFGVAVF